MSKVYGSRSRSAAKRMGNGNEPLFTSSTGLAIFSGYQAARHNASPSLFVQPASALTSYTPAASAWTKANVIQREVDLTNAQWTSYVAAAKKNWPVANKSEVLARAKIDVVRKTIGTLEELDRLVNCTFLEADVFEYYKNSFSALASLLTKGATATDVAAAMLSSGKAASAANLDWFEANHESALRLKWEAWLPYTYNNTYKIANVDPEIVVEVGRQPWAVIHAHYKRREDAKDPPIKFEQDNIVAIHIKPNRASQDRDKLEQKWKAKCHTIAAANLASRGDVGWPVAGSLVPAAVPPPAAVPAPTAVLAPPTNMWSNKSLLSTIISSASSREKGQS